MLVQQKMVVSFQQEKKSDYEIAVMQQTTPLGVSYNNSIFTDLEGSPGLTVVSIKKKIEQRGNDLPAGFLVNRDMYSSRMR